MTATEMPTYKDLLWPTLEVLKKNGGAASIKELSEQVTRLLALPDEVSDRFHGEGPQTEVGYRLAWARTNLKWAGAVDNTARGVWRITPTGRAMRSDKESRDLVRRERKRRSRERDKPERADRSKESEPLLAGDWKEGLLAILREMTPDTFERLCQRILRESGFTKVEVTGRSGDGGIDGAGVLRVNLISFHVRFQRKRYAVKSSIIASEVVAGTSTSRPEAVPEASQPESAGLERQRRPQELDDSAGGISTETKETVP